MMAGLDILGSGPPLRNYTKYYNLCVIKRRAILEELPSVTALVSECL